MEQSTQCPDHTLGKDIIVITEYVRLFGILHYSIIYYNRLSCVCHKDRNNQFFTRALAAETYQYLYIIYLYTNTLR